MFLKMNKLQPKWTQEMEEDFIEAVKLRPHLWDPNCKSIHLKHNLYDEIAQELIIKYRCHKNLFTRKSLCEKFKNLRTYYKREISKETAKPGHKVMWIHYQRLSFLSDPTNFLPRDSTTDLSDSQLEDVDNIEDIIINETEQQEQSDTDLKNDFSSESERSEEHIQTIHDKPKKKAFKRKATTLSHGAETVSGTQVIEEKNLGLYIAARIYSIKNRTKRNNLTVEIINMINSYDDEYDNEE